MADKSSREGIIEPHEDICNDGCGINGVEKNTEEDKYGITVTRIRIFNEQGAEAMGKPVGNYVTLQSQALTNGDLKTQPKIVKRLAQEIRKFKFLHRYVSVLVVGLGNQNVTPDALGPKVCSNILVTKHWQSSAPDGSKGRIRDVSAISPGVMGVTGIESFEIVKGVTDKTKPGAVIIVDALAAGKINRINTTVQMTDTGITPGAGMGNKRMMFSEETLGVPVLSIGAPTVVGTAVIVNDAMTEIFDSMKRISPKYRAISEMFADLQEEEKSRLIKEILPENMFLTDKDINVIINRLADIISGALNIALNPNLT